MQPDSSSPCKKCCEVVIVLLLPSPPASKVELYVGRQVGGTSSLDHAEFLRLGYISLSDNEQTGFRVSAQLRSTLGERETASDFNYTQHGAPSDQLCTCSTPKLLKPTEAVEASPLVLLIQAELSSFSLTTLAAVVCGVMHIHVELWAWLVDYVSPSSEWYVQPHSQAV